VGTAVIGSCRSNFSGNPDYIYCCHCTVPEVCSRCVLTPALLAITSKRKFLVLAVCKRKQEELKKQLSALQEQSEEHEATEQNAFHYNCFREHRLHLLAETVSDSLYRLYVFRAVRISFDLFPQAAYF
jgi:hypothetical protein